MNSYYRIISVFEHKIPDRIPTFELEIHPLIIESNIDCLNSIDPLAGMDIVKLKKQYGRRVALMGNVNCATTLVNGKKMK